MRFADPYLLALLLLLPLLLFLKGRVLRESGFGGYSSLALLDGFRPTWRLRYRWLPTAIRAAALVLLILALARPQTGEADSEIPGQGVDIVLVFDTSSSMVSFNLGRDTRLAVAQRVLDKFIAGREDDRLGLVIFRSDGLVLSPLTLDYDALRALVAGVEQINLSDGTAIGTGLAEGINLLRDSRARSRVAILATDGENNSGQIDPLSAARIAETLGIRVYTIGLLETGGRANVDERALQEMAQLTGGRYFPAESEQALAAIYENVDQLEKSRVGRIQFGSFSEVAPYFLAAALLLLALEFALRGTLWRQST